MMQEYHDLFKVVDELHKWDWKYFSNALTLNLNIIVIKLLYNNRIMIVEPMVQRGLPRKDSINPLSKKQNLGILTFYKVRLFKQFRSSRIYWSRTWHGNIESFRIPIKRFEKTVRNTIFGDFNCRFYNWSSSRILCFRVHQKQYWQIILSGGLFTNYNTNKFYNNNICVCNC